MKKFIKNSNLLLMAVIGLLFVFNALHSQYNDYFYAKYDGQGNMYFQWYFDNNKNVVDNFVIYKAEGAYKKFDQDVFLEYRKLSLDDVRQEKNSLFTYKTQDKLEKDEYSFVIFINLKDGSVIKSAPFIVFNNFVPPSKSIYFESEPVRVAFINKEYKYQAKAVLYPEENLELVYKLTKGPEGMKINNATGEITWTPTKILKNVFVSIAAYVKNNTKIIAYQDFDIYVFTCSNPVVLSGKIIDKNDKPVEHGYVVLHPKDFVNSDKPEEAIQFGSEVINGEYKIEADAGIYFMHFYDMLGRTYVFDNASNIKKPTLIELKCGTNKEISWKIENLSDKFYTASGKVIDENGTPVPYFPVIFESIPSGEVNIPENYFSTSALTDEEGNYEVQLPEDYKFIAYIHLINSVGLKNMPVLLFYNQTFKRNEATIINSDKDYSGIDFKFMKNPDFVYHKVTGKVTDKSNKPMEGVLVSFEGFNEKTNKDGYYHYYDAVYTDNNGDYTIELPDLFKYIAYAINKEGMDINRDYSVLFYKQTYIREKATILEIKKDLSGIDFKFEESKEPTTYQSAITGKVLNFEGNPIQYAFVEAIRLDNDDIDYKDKSHFAYTDMNGAFAFKGLKPGKYIIFASTQKNIEFSCGYYVEGGMATINFEEATRIELDGKNIVEKIIINLPKFEIKKGGGIIKGEIYNERNFSEAKKLDNAISSAKLFLKEENKKSLVNFNESNSNGSFVITGVPSGKYTFVIEKVGFQKFEKLLEVDEANITDLGLIMLVPIVGNSVEDPTNINSFVYPNPAASEITFEFNSTNKIHNIAIMSQDGKFVRNENVNLFNGTNSVKINVSSLSNGKYFILVSDGNNNYAIPFMVNR